MPCKWLGAPMIALLLLTSCGGDGGEDAQQMALDLRTTYLSMTACQSTLQVTADYGQRVYTYEMDMTWEGTSTTGETTLVVTAPEEIAGLTIVANQEESVLQYDGISLETGSLYEGGTNPVQCIPTIIQSIRTNFIAECGFELVGEETQLRMVCRNPENSSGTGEEVTLWFSQESGALRKGELSVEGVTVVFCIFENFSMVVP